MTEQPEICVHGIRLPWECKDCIYGPPNHESGLTAARPASTDDRVGVDSKPIPIEERVTGEMRQAAIDYWVKVNTRNCLIPIGEINGIIYAALEASEWLAKITALEARNAELRGTWLKVQAEQQENLDRLVEKLTALQASSQMLQVKLDAATEDRDKWLGEHNLLQRERDEDKRRADIFAQELRDAYELSQAKVEQLSRNSEESAKWVRLIKSWALNRSVALEREAIVTAADAALQPQDAKPTTQAELEARGLA